MRTLLRQSPGESQIQSLAWLYWIELTTDYRGPLEQVGEHVSAEAQPGETLLTTYEHYTLLFHTPLHVLRADRASRGEGLPEWILLHGGGPKQLPPWIEEARRRRYRRVPLDAHEYPWENIPEPYWHRFRTPETGPRVRLFRRGDRNFSRGSSP